MLVSTKTLQLPQALELYREMFDNESAALLPFHKAIDHAINLVDSKEPLYRPLYLLSTRELEVL